MVYPGVAKFGIALEWGSRGRWFESSHSDQQIRLQIERFEVFFVVLKTLLLLFFCELYREKTKIAGSEQFSEQLKASKILLILFDVSSAAASGTWV